MSGSKLGALASKAKSGQGRTRHPRIAMAPPPAEVKQKQMNIAESLGFPSGAVLQYKPVPGQPALSPSEQATIVKALVQTAGAMNAIDSAMALLDEADTVASKRRRVEDVAAQEELPGVAAPATPSMPGQQEPAMPSLFSQEVKEAEDAQPTGISADNSPPKAAEGAEAAERGDEDAREAEREAKEATRKRAEDEAEDKGVVVSDEEGCEGEGIADALPVYCVSPTCCKCKSLVDPLDARLIGRKQGVWQCKVCSSRYSQLHRRFGGWPPAQFREISEEERTEFWKQAAIVADSKGLERLVVKTLEARVVAGRSAGSRGQYLPLGAYEKMGFDTQAIQERCSDVREHPILGTTYRVDVEFQSKERTEQEVQQEVVRSVQQQLEKAKAKAKAKPKAKGKVKEDDIAKPSKKMTADATKVLAKVTAATKNVRAAVKMVGTSNLPEQHKTKLQDQASVFQCVCLFVSLLLFLLFLLLFLLWSLLF